MKFTNQDLNKTIWVHPTHLKEIRKRYQIDVTGLNVWRVATVLASYLIGKNNTHYCDFWNTGHAIVVHNVEKMNISGKKNAQKNYFFYSGYKGNLRTFSYDQMKKKDPLYILEHAVSGMLPKNKLRAVRLKNLKLMLGVSTQYDHLHPETITLHD